MPAGRNWPRCSPATWAVSSRSFANSTAATDDRPSRSASDDSPDPETVHGDCPNCRGAATKMGLSPLAKDDRPRIGLVVVDDGLYTHRWATAVLDQPEFQPVGVACLSPYWAVHFNPGDARGCWRVARSRLAYYGVAAGLGLVCKASGAAVGGWRYRLGLGGGPAAWRLPPVPAVSKCCGRRQRHRRVPVSRPFEKSSPGSAGLRVFSAGRPRIPGAAAMGLPKCPFLAAGGAPRAGTVVSRACWPAVGRAYRSTG